MKPDYELLAKIKPDLVFYDSQLYSQEDLDKVKSTTGAEMFGITADSIDDYLVQLYDIGTLLGCETRVNDYVIKIRGEVQSAEGDVLTPRPKVAVIMPSDGSGDDYVAGTKGFIASAVKAGGGDLVGPDTKIFTPMNAEAVIAANPDVIIVPGTKTDVKAALTVLGNPKYKTLNAVKNQRVRAVDQDVLLRRGGRVDLLVKGIHQALVGGKK